jgi:hypothetical protein
MKLRIAAIVCAFGLIATTLSVGVTEEPSGTESVATNVSDETGNRSQVGGPKLVWEWLTKWFPWKADEWIDTGLGGTMPQFEFTIHCSVETEPVDYLTQIKPIFADHCAGCHGADDQQSGFRIDTAALARTGGDRGAGIVPGKSADSLLYQALVGTGDVTAMPFEDERLPAEAIELIKRWIDEGAKGPADEQPAEPTVANDHWSFQPVVRPEVPQVKHDGWVQNPIDAFILARLEQEGVQPSPEADRVTLIRRLSLDLRGLPPTVAEIESFVGDTRPDAYERLVDQFLASSHYGERWGRHWLDVARYADSHGFTIDGARSIWKYRDWVIDAFNRDLPFDQFTIEQLAGDLLPNATTEQIIATGFHRNTLVNQEGGTDAEQFRVEAIDDRVNTTSTAFLGLTIACAQCHQHKYDPISQRDYYQMFAFFNNCDEPNISVPSDEQTARMQELNAQIAQAEKPLAAHDAEFLKGLPEWEKQLAGPVDDELWTPLDPVELGSEQGSVLNKQDDRSVFVDFSTPPSDTYIVTLETSLESVTAVRLEALTHPSLPKNGPGYASNGNFVLTGFEVAAGALKTAGEAVSDRGEGVRDQESGVRDDLKLQAVPLARAVADHSQDNYPIENAIDGSAKTGWAINVKRGNPNVDREAIFFPAETIRHKGGVRLVVRMRHEMNSKYLIGRFRLSVTDASPELLSVPAAIRAIAAIPADERTPEQHDQLADAFKQTDLARKPLADKVAQLKRQKDSLQKDIPTTMVLRERKAPRETHIHIRGDFLRKGSRVEPGVPSVLPPLSDDLETPNRLDLARWLVDPGNPLTARVTVNRFWQRYFGLGLVDTEDDFGTQGSPPSHPELLDWLADEFMQQGWSMKSLHKLIVTSATYRQSSAIREDLLQRDPANRLLARQSRLRLEAEIIRDVALASSGLMSEEVGGPSVYPPQPEGIYVLTQTKKSWPVSQGPQRYRRGMYTFFWRSSPYPLLPTFDAPNANTTCTRRARSNTPLQALTLANDQAFVEIAQGLAARILREAPDYDEGRLRHAFRLCMTREPSDREMQRLTEFLNLQRANFESRAEEAKLVAPADRPNEVTVPEAAAWTAVARVFLNLDEFITRE